MINPNEAPDGYQAVVATDGIGSCLGCDFYNRPEVMCGNESGVSCFWWNRKDDTSVIFKKKETTSDNTTQP